MAETIILSDGSRVEVVTREQISVPAVYGQDILDCHKKGIPVPMVEYVQVRVK